MINANVTGNLGIKSGNFSLAVALAQTVTGFTVSNVNLVGDITGVTFTVEKGSGVYYLSEK